MQRVILLLCLVFSFIACDAIIEVVDISDKTVSILAPTNNSVIDTTAVTFTWNAIEDTEQYKLQVATPTFENASQILVDTIIAKTNYSKTLEAADYQWRVRAENSDYQTVFTVNSFTVEE